MKRLVRRETDQRPERRGIVDDHLSRSPAGEMCSGARGSRIGGGFPPGPLETVDREEALRKRTAPAEQQRATSLAADDVEYGDCIGPEAGPDGVAHRAGNPCDPVMRA